MAGSIGQNRFGHEFGESCRVRRDAPDVTLERFRKSCGELASRHSVFHQVRPSRRGHVIDQTGLTGKHSADVLFGHRLNDPLFGNDGRN